MIKGWDDGRSRMTVVICTYPGNTGRMDLTRER